MCSLTRLHVARCSIPSSLTLIHSFGKVSRREWVHDKNWCIYVCVWVSVLVNVYAYCIYVYKYIALHPRSLCILFHRGLYIVEKSFVDVDSQQRNAHPKPTEMYVKEYLWFAVFRFQWCCCIFFFCFRSFSSNNVITIGFMRFACFVWLFTHVFFSLLLKILQLTLIWSCYHWIGESWKRKRLSHFFPLYYEATIILKIE